MVGPHVVPTPFMRARSSAPRLFKYFPTRPRKYKKLASYNTPIYLMRPFLVNNLSFYAGCERNLLCHSSLAFEI